MNSHMREWLLGALLCLIPGVALGQQSDMQVPKSQIPEDNAPSTKPRHDQKLSTKEVDEKLRNGFDNKNPAYAGSNIQVVVEDQSITLTGTVQSEGQREMALQLARAYADDRTIIDRLVIQ
jgi:osmotically-inducible protein OsmY